MATAIQVLHPGNNIIINKKLTDFFSFGRFAQGCGIFCERHNSFIGSWLGQWLSVLDLAEWNLPFSTWWKRNSPNCKTESLCIVDYSWSVQQASTVSGNGRQQNFLNRLRRWQFEWVSQAVQFSQQSNYLRVRACSRWFPVFRRASTASRCSIVEWNAKERDQQAFIQFDFNSSWISCTFAERL